MRIGLGRVYLFWFGLDHGCGCLGVVVDWRVVRHQCRLWLVD